MNSVKIVLLGFIILILIGAAALLLPGMVHSPYRLGVVDALFTSTSAVCVTGLITVDTAAFYTPLGKCVILILIQLGGFGIMFVSTLFLSMFSVRSSIETRTMWQETLLENETAKYTRVVAVLFSYVIAVELIGAVLLFSQFIGEFPADHALFHSIFQSVSAFCNAGFSSFTSNLEHYTGNHMILFVIESLIILGGLGFPVTLGVYYRFFAKRRMSVNTRISVVMTTLLIVGGFMFLFLIESGSEMSGMSWPQKIHNALFQSITARTAGFNTVSMARLQDLSLLVMIALMFIGGCPGGTAGGVKTTTFSVILLTFRSMLKERNDVEFHGRRIEQDIVIKSIVIFVTGIILIGIVTGLLVITEKTIGSGHGAFMEMFFEAVSAIGTVGLSMGVTPSLSVPGKLIIIVSMFLGRVGPITVFLLLSARAKESAQYRYPVENVLVG